MATKLEQHAIRKRSGIDRAIRQAERQLADADPVMKRLIARHGRCPLAERNFEPFHMLANSIISQQLSTRAAATIKQRVGALVGVPFQADKFFTCRRSYCAALDCLQQRRATSASSPRVCVTAD